MINKNTKFLIVGLGLLGGSYALGLKKEGYYVSAITRSKDTLQYGFDHNMIDEGSCAVDEKLIQNADVVIFCLYPTAMVDWIKNYQHLFKKGTLLTDVSGVKRNIVNTIQSFLRDDIEFISAHPMAGKENSGIKYANTEMFKNANYIITPTLYNSKEAIDFSYDLAYTLHFNHIAVLDIDKHDQMIAFLSQLTHVIAVSLMNTHDNAHLVEYTGDSFRDLTRIAKINETMWSELFLLNKDILIDEIDAFIDSIKHFKDTLEKEDTDEMKRLFIQSTKRRKRFDK